MQPPEGPPICTALNFLPAGGPLPTSKITVRSEVPIATSTSPARWTFPLTAKILVPLLVAVPTEA